MKRFVTGCLLVTAALVALTIVFALGVVTGNALDDVPLLDERVDHTDLTHDERMKLVERCFPDPLPAGSTVSSLEYESWLDWHLTATVELPETGFEPFAESFLAKQRELGHDTAPYSLAGNVMGSVALDLRGRNLQLECFER